MCQVMCFFDGLNAANGSDLDIDHASQYAVVQSKFCKAETGRS